MQAVSVDIMGYHSHVYIMLIGKIADAIMVINQ